MKKFLSFVVIFCISVNCAFAEKVTKTKLPNGQTVIVKEIHSNPVVMVDTWVKTGSVDENDQNNGVAHFLEHLFFKGSKNYPNNDFDKILVGIGSEFSSTIEDSSLIIKAYNNLSEFYYTEDGGISYYPCNTNINFCKKKNSASK